MVTSYGLVAAGQYAYSADVEGYFGIASIANRAAPTVIEMLAAPTYARDLALRGAYAYVADQSGLTVVRLGGAP